MGDLWEDTNFSNTMTREIVTTIERLSRSKLHILVANRVLLKHFLSKSVSSARVVLN